MKPREFHLQLKSPSKQNAYPNAKFSLTNLAPNLTSKLSYMPTSQLYHYAPVSLTCPKLNLFNSFSVFKANNILRKCTPHTPRCFPIHFQDLIHLPSSFLRSLRESLPRLSASG